MKKKQFNKTPTLCLDLFRLSYIVRHIKNLTYLRNTSGKPEIKSCKLQWASTVHELRATFQRLTGFYLEINNSDKLLQ